MRRFSIRDLFWLTLVVAALMGWWVDRQSAAAERRALAEDRDAAHADNSQWEATAMTLLDLLKRYKVEVKMNGPRIEWVQTFYESQP